MPNERGYYTHILLPTKNDLKENREDDYHDRNKNANREVWLFLSLLNEILQDKLIIQGNVPKITPKWLIMKEKSDDLQVS